MCLMRTHIVCVNTNVCCMLISSDGNPLHAFTQGHHLIRDAKSTKKKLQRGKTYIHCMNVNNILKQSAGITMKKFKILWPDGAPHPPSSPFEWPHLNMVEDRASENVCLDHTLSYRKDEKYNVHTDWDINHSTTLSSSTAIKRANLWRHHVSLTNYFPGVLLICGLRMPQTLASLQNCAAQASRSLASR